MPSPKNTTRTLAEVRAECIALGVQPGRSIAECENRIAAVRQGDEAFEANAVGRATAAPGQVRGISRDVAAARVIPGIKGPLTSPEPATPEEEQAMAKYSAEMRRMDTMGETAWLAEQFKPCACGNCTGETGCTQQPAKIVHADYGEIEARALAMGERHYAKLARHGAAHRSGAGLFLAAAAALGSLPPTPPALREQARSFDAPKSKDQVRRDVRRKMRKATRQAQRRARG